MKNKNAKVIFSLIMLISLFCVLTVTASATEYYVDVNKGSDSNAGSFDAPFASIQKAADKVQAGDTVIIRPGIYYENVWLNKNGTKDRPIIFKAEKFEKDSVIITGADRDIAEHKVEWTLEDANLGMYSIPLDYPIYRMTANDVQVVGYTSLEGLKTYTYNAAGFSPGYEHGFYYDDTNKKLYVRLGNDGCIETDDPNSDKVTINLSRTKVAERSNWNGKDYAAQAWSAITGKDSFLFGVTTEQEANVVISGITFKMPAVTAVWARCHDLTVSNCWFIGCIEGVRGGCAATSDPTFVSKNIIIEYCFYTNFPIYTDAIKIIEKYKNDVVARNISVDENGNIKTKATDPKKLADDATVPRVLWFWQAKSGTPVNYECGGLACYIGEDWIVRYNHFDDVYDGFSSFGNFSYWVNLRQTPAKNLQIYGNKFDKVLDNSIETEDNVQGMEIAYNEFTHQISPFTWQPLSGMPYPTNINIHHNIVYNTPEEGWLLASARGHIEKDGKFYRFSSPQYTGLFKLGAGKSEYTKLAWMKEQNFPLDADGNPLDAVAPAEDGIKVWNNTFIFPDGAFEENVGLLSGGQENNSNIDFKNNIINVVVCAEDGTFKGGFKAGQAHNKGRGVTFSNNMLVAGLNIVGSRLMGDIKDTTDVPRTTYVNEVMDDNGIYKESIEGVGFEDWRNGNFELKEDSAARGAGVQLSHTDESTVDLGAIPYGEKWVMTAGPYGEADINLDGNITLSDVAKVVYAFTSGEYNDRADLDYNGIVDENDIEIMLDIYNVNGGALK